jgi:hypothetical protein
MELKQLKTRFKNITIDEIHQLANYYEIQNDIMNMLKCYKIGVKIKDELSTWCLMKYYYDNKNFEEAIKYMDIMLENDGELEVHIIVELAEYLRNNNQIDKMKQYLNKLVDNNIPLGMVELGNYYHSIHDFENMEKYFLMAIEYDCYECAYDLSMYYKSIGEYDNSLKYLKLAAEHSDMDDTYAYMELGKYYDSIDDIENMKKYMLIAYEYSKIDGIKLDFSPENVEHILEALHDKYINIKNQNKELQTKNKELELENADLKYRPNGIGYEKSKKRFYELANQ